MEATLVRGFFNENRQMKIYHNPRCSKSRQTLALLKEHGVNPEIVLYLDKALTNGELQGILKKLGKQPFDLVRKGEAVYKEQFKGRELSDAEWIAAMIKYPKLMERPIVVTEKEARVGRPPEAVLELM